MRISVRFFSVVAALCFIPVTPGWRTAPDPALAPGSITPYDSIRTDLREYIWPMRTSRVMTSSFGEYRSTHFHAGIDIGTGDTVGLPVMASRDGYISHISVSPEGYGKILHVRHADHYTTTYAHLQKFSPRLESLVRAAQRRRGMFPVDLSFTRDTLRVTTGEIIAYAGDTGTGSAHLHFEIRDEHNNCINPLLAEPFIVDDTLPPLFRTLAFVPVDESGVINDSTAPVTAAARQVTPGNFVIDAVPVLAGTIGLAVDVRDRSDFSNYFHGFHVLSLAVDSVTVMGVRYDRVPLREGNQIRLVYLQNREMKKRGRFHKLYIDTRHRLPIFPGFDSGSGLLRTSLLQPGKHAFTVTCIDYNGNTAKLSGVFRSGGAGSAVTGKAGGAQERAVRPSPYRIEPGGSGELVLERGKLRVLYKRGAVFHPIDLNATPIQEKGVTGFSFEPAGMPLDGGLTFILPKPSQMRNAGVFTRDGSEWEFHSRARADSSGRVTVRLRRFLQDISFQEDSQPPEMYRLRIEGSGRKPRISFRFRDNLSGVEYDDVKVYIDKTMIIPEIDGEHRRAIAQPETALKKGSHQLTVHLADRMGNSAHFERSFHVR
ncbi:MAG: family metallopeptidase [Bacteroidetes bacterium]|nr:family metallopeptidase [Bacteroidota bacterium]